nr:uncharacterized protein LOC120366794 [Saimiri boliviensis boliviensis]
MLLKTNWQNLGHGAVGGYGLLLSLGLRGSGCPGSPRERRRRGGGRLGSAGSSPGTQETGRRTKQLGSGAEAPGARRAAMAEPGAAQTPETAEPRGWIPETELRPVASPAPALCTLPRSGARGGRRNSGRGARRPSRPDAHGETETPEGLLFRLIFAKLLFLPPPRLFFFFFFSFCHIMRLGANNVTSVGALGPTHVLPCARDADGEGSAGCCQNGAFVPRSAASSGSEVAGGPP